MERLVAFVRQEAGRGAEGGGGFVDEVSAADLVAAEIAARARRRQGKGSEEHLLPDAVASRHDFFWTQLVQPALKRWTTSEDGGPQTSSEVEGDINGVGREQMLEDLNADSNARLFSHVIFVDADSLFTDPKRDLSHLLKRVYPLSVGDAFDGEGDGGGGGASPAGVSKDVKHMLFVGDKEAAANSGHILLANTAVSRALVAEWAGAIDFRIGSTPTTVDSRNIINGKPAAGDMTGANTKSNEEDPLYYKQVRHFNDERITVAQPPHNHAKADAWFRELYKRFRNKGFVNHEWMSKHGLPCSIGGEREGLMAPDQGPLGTLLSESWSNIRKFVGDHGARGFCRKDQRRFEAERREVWRVAVRALLATARGERQERTGMLYAVSPAARAPASTSGSTTVSTSDTSTTWSSNPKKRGDRPEDVSTSDTSTTWSPNPKKRGDRPEDVDDPRTDCLYVTNYCLRFATPTWVKTSQVLEKDVLDQLAFAKRRNLLWAPYFTLVPQKEFNSYEVDPDPADGGGAEETRPFVFHAAGVREHKFARIRDLVSRLETSAPR